MIEMFRGDTLILTITPENYKFKTGDVLHYAIMDNAYSEKYIYDNTIKIEKDIDSVDIVVEPKDTKNFEIGKLLLEIELSYANQIIVTNQYQLVVKADGIYDRD